MNSESVIVKTSGTYDAIQYTSHAESDNEPQALDC